MNTVTREDITCKELVELVTEYLEGALTPIDAATFERHIAACTACATYLEQIRVTITLSGRLTQDTIDPAARDALIDAFRNWKSNQA